MEVSLTIWTAGTGAVLPAIMPSSNPSIDHAGNKVLVQLIITDPLLFQIWEYHTELHYRFKFGRHLVGHCDFLESYSQIIESLNQRMRNVETQCSDSSILCVVGVTTYGPLMAKPLERTRWPSQGPLTNLNCLDTLGRLPSVQLHINGLAQLVGMRGGIQNVKTPGMAPLISL
jgi:hypothetical protein